MSLINYASREINCKIVYYGPGLGGKTTNIKYVYKQIDADARGKLVSLATETDRTLFFDFLPLDLGQVQGFTTRFHLYTVPGQVHYDASRRLILKGADGIIFVADSQKERLQDNIDSFKNLRVNLKSQSIEPDSIPLVIQYNKMDLPNVMSAEALDEKINDKGYLSFESIAIEGVGVFDTLRAISKLVLKSISEGR
ncbi:MAG: gliding-motility protein MglA [Candidatus Mcinerneyibacterium aminivorans]|uniref:Gliding-motility protein MglA n=1 Tax=Candidatus Mcinerneyibacterium aminivorans TaxID=2703815 RepID=A0A5D0MJR5_9BACT|nr:MAG: gliding-motility protein MglA [Candidatus Mcinerneyibacterium aminivorans]